MSEVNVNTLSIEQLLIRYLNKIEKFHEYDRLIKSMWTIIEGEKVISLDLSRLEIDQIHPCLFSHPSFSDLEYLYLQGNNINKLHNKIFTNLRSLRGLNLPNNQLQKIESETFIELNNLEWLNLSSNQLSELSIDAFQGLLMLKSLNLSHNNLTELQSHNFRGLNSLEKLKISNNSLKNIDGSEFEELHNLKYLNLQSNKLIQVGMELPSKLPNLDKLYLKHNPAFTINNTFETRYEIIEVFRSKFTNQTDRAMSEILDFEDDEIVATFNQLIEDPRWDGGIGRVSNYKLSQVVGIPIEQIARKIENLITQKKLENIVHFDNSEPMAFEKHYWIRNSKSQISINTDINEPKCLWCNERLDDPFDACPNCELRCEICKFSIKQTQKFDVCTSEDEDACLDIFHRSEFVEWVRIYGSCPKCSRDINLNLYQVSQDYSEKVRSLVEQDMELVEEKNTHSNDFLVPMALSILINLKKIRKEVKSSDQAIKELGNEAREQHQEVLKELQPLATEIVLITAFLNRLENNTLTEESFKASINHIASRFDIFEENIDLIYEAHQKDKSKREKIKKLVSKGGLKGGEIGVKAMVERSGLLGKIGEYVKFPTKNGLKLILQRIGQGIRDKTGDPTSWIKLGAAFLI